MENQVASGWEQVNVAAQGLSHPAFDAVAIMRFAQDFACGESNARRRSRGGHVVR
jgi:hypothetical protein